MYDAKVMVLSKCVDYHVKEEQDDMFANAKVSSIDLLDLVRDWRLAKKTGTLSSRHARLPFIHAARCEPGMAVRLGGAQRAV